MKNKLLLLSFFCVMSTVTNYSYLHPMDSNGTEENDNSNEKLIECNGEKRILQQWIGVCRKNPNHPFSATSVIRMVTKDGKEKIVKKGTMHSLDQQDLIDVLKGNYIYYKVFDLSLLDIVSREKNITENDTTSPSVTRGAIFLGAGSQAHKNAEYPLLTSNNNNNHVVESQDYSNPLVPIEHGGEKRNLVEWIEHCKKNPGHPFSTTLVIRFQYNEFVVTGNLRNLRAEDVQDIVFGNFVYRTFFCLPVPAYTNPTKRKLTKNTLMAGVGAIILGTKDKLICNSLCLIDGKIQTSHITDRASK